MTTVTSTATQTSSVNSSQFGRAAETILHIGMGLVAIAAGLLIPVAATMLVIIALHAPVMPLYIAAGIFLAFTRLGSGFFAHGLKAFEKAQVAWQGKRLPDELGPPGVFKRAALTTTTAVAGVINLAGNIAIAGLIAIFMTGMAVGASPWVLPLVYGLAVTKLGLGLWGAQLDYKRTIRAARGGYHTFAKAFPS